MTTTSGRLIAPAALAALLAGTLTPVLAGPAAAAAPVAPVLLGSPRPSATASDISPAGVVVGSSTAVTAGLPTAERWVPTRTGGWARRPLAQPAGATSSDTDGVSDAGEAGGYTSDGTTTTAQRWPAGSGQPTALAPAPSTTGAVGPGGEVLVDLNQTGFTGTTAIVTRDGTTTPITGVPGRSVNGISIAGPETALVGAVEGIGQGTTVTPYVYESGVAQALPVFSSYFLGPACVSDVQADGSVAFAGWSRVPDAPAPGVIRRIGVLRGGVGGVDQSLELPPGASAASLGESCGGRADTLSADGWAAGTVTANAVTQAVVWRPDGSWILPGLDAGETSSAAVAVATGGRAVLRVATATGTQLHLWHDGVRTPLRIPTGWNLARVVELTDTGLVLANLTRTVGDVQQFRPAVWRIPAARG